MKKKHATSFTAIIALLLAVGLTAPARASELDDLKATMQSMQKSMEQMQKKIAELEQQNRKAKQQAVASRAAPPAPSEGPAAGAVSDQTVTIAPTAVTI